MNEKNTITAGDFFQTIEMMRDQVNAVSQIWKLLVKDDAQTIRRSFIRALFAAIEASLYQVKMNLIYAQDQGGHSIHFIGSYNFFKRTRPPLSETVDS